MRVRSDAKERERLRVSLRRGPRRLGQRELAARGGGAGAADGGDEEAYGALEEEGEGGGDSEGHWRRKEKERRGLEGGG